MITDYTAQDLTITLEQFLEFTKSSHRSNYNLSYVNPTLDMCQCQGMDDRQLWAVLNLEQDTGTRGFWTQRERIVEKHKTLNYV